MLLSVLAEKLNAELNGDAACGVSAVASLEKAGPGQLSFLSNSKFRSYLADTQASAVLIKAADLPFVAPGVNSLVVADPYVAFAKAAQLFDTTPDTAKLGIAPSAVIDASANIAADAHIGANAVISANAKIAAGVQIGAGCFIGEGTEIAENTRLWANVTVYHGVKIGARCVIQSGAVIGADGFGFANERGRWLKIPQTGGVRIGDDCEIGANICIDRGAIDDTVIGNNVILDNLSQIAHNVVIGDHTAIAGATTVAGSTTIGRYCIIGGAAAINGHISICDGVHISGMAMVMKSISEKGIYTSGLPATTNAEWRKTTAKLRQIDQLYQRVKLLEKQLAAADGSADSALED
ncbi:UDP-3-O-(3-hydroxymyristoyl)glucosamine N-acyltransferase [Rheinheimera sp. UJ51]|uniref:UDP-3-O-(3-hydroxymyristoyl)glucosamine N-acyltransferase n=1 Tax=Rheinheimera sp. UJ51 TaxID=2892446 RepID=UPI001E2D75C1|nr:UDP-3-O-(3-hydroxymyristoyl)glucosamine N-acyltransferase [Rheinheimera sp. UJ51]MCC5451582.1 UDP-3-O-(3-hydroxymyristoyl)glucosamine N-acyltransferase [Rheinheimera sp. UJ51]